MENSAVQEVSSFCSQVWNMSQMIGRCLGDQYYNSLVLNEKSVSQEEVVQKAFCQYQEQSQVHKRLPINSYWMSQLINEQVGEEEREVEDYS